MKNSKNKPFQQVPGGEYDNYGFYYTPDGSFWDPDGIFFNNDGYDCHGGYYSENLEYCPGPGWIEELMCYEDEKQDVLRKMGGVRNDHNKFNDLMDDEFEDEGDVDDIYEDVDYDKLLDEQNEKIGNVELIEEKQEEKKVYNPKNASNMMKSNVITSIKEENEIENNEPNKKEEIKITSDMLFNKIPDDLKPKEVKDNEKNKNMTKVEKTIEVDSLFG